jgi:hypothetical protein
MTRRVNQRIERPLPASIYAGILQPSATQASHPDRRALPIQIVAVHLLASRSGLSTAEEPMADVAAKIAELVAL